jgi:hypothetical protein
MGPRFRGDDDFGGLKIESSAMDCVTNAPQARRFTPGRIMNGYSWNGIGFNSLVVGGFSRSTE